MKAFIIVLMPIIASVLVPRLSSLAHVLRNVSINILETFSFHSSDLNVSLPAHIVINKLVGLTHLFCVVPRKV